LEMMTTMRIGWLLGLVGLVGIGCGPEDPDDVACERQPPYRLAVMAADGALPSSTVVRIKHGGGEVEYALSDPPTESDLVFCEPSEAGHETVALRCDLWTQGAVTIIVEADGYERVEEQASLDWEGDCVVTLDVEVELSPPERG
jgi:hypothetical protein